jgi:hypothetical protein
MKRAQATDAAAKNVGIWIRVSTEDQVKGESPEHHERRARYYAESKDWNVAVVWLLEHLDIVKQSPFKQGYSGDTELNREFSSWRFVEGRVCKPCNSGWMSRLERQAAPTLISLIDGTQNLAGLSERESAVIAKWATKIAYVLANASLANKPVPRRHLHSLCGDEGVIPRGVGVFGLQAVYDKPISYLQVPYWAQIIGEGAIPIDPNNENPEAYKMVVQYQHLILMVAHWPYQPGEMTIAAGFHVPLWPRKVMWPAYMQPREIAPPSSLPIMKSFAETLVVWSMPVALGPLPKRYPPPDRLDDSISIRHASLVRFVIRHCRSFGLVEYRSMRVTADGNRSNSDFR